MILAWLLRFGRNESGSVAVTSAISMTAVLSFTALALDSGSLFVDKRQQQSATDFAALAAASNLSTATAAATASAQANGMAASAISKVELGTYVSDTTVAPSQRFTPTTGGTPNAVRVTMRQPQPYIFGSLLTAAVSGAQNTSSTSATIQTQSVAASRNVASFAIGSGLASLNNGILNSVLGSLIGGNLSLSLMDYQSLAAANVNLFTFSNALATGVGITGGTYSTLATGSVSLANALRAASASVSSSQASSALASIIAAVGAQTANLSIGTLVNFGSYGSMSVGSMPALGANVSALTLVSALIQAANGRQQVATALSIAVPGITSATLGLAVGEPAVGSSLIAMGPQGTTLTTAQTRLLLTLQVTGPPGATLLTVPIELQIASGTAVLNSVQCTGSSVSTVQLGVTPGLASAWIGTVSNQALTTMSTPLSPTNATLLNVLGLVTITGRASASIANTTATTVPFSGTDIASGTSKTVSTTDYLAPLLSSLFNNLSLNVWVFGLNAVGTSALNLSIMQTLAADVTPIDSIIASVLVALGVSVGNATVWVSGAQCGQSALVN